MCAAIGVGAVRPGPVVVSLGTSGTAFAYSERPAVDPQGEAAAFCDSTGGWLPLVCTLGCTVATEWVRGLFGLDHAGVERALAATEPGAGPSSCHTSPASAPPACRRRPASSPGSGPATARTTWCGPSWKASRSGWGTGWTSCVGPASSRPPSRWSAAGRPRTAGRSSARTSSSLPVLRPSVSEAAALGAALQARQVVDGVGPPAAPVDATWEPRPSDGAPGRPRADRRAAPPRRRAQPVATIAPGHHVAHSEPVALRDVLDGIAASDVAPERRRWNTGRLQAWRAELDSRVELDVIVRAPHHGRASPVVEAEVDPDGRHPLRHEVEHQLTTAIAGDQRGRRGGRRCTGLRSRTADGRTGAAHRRGRRSSARPSGYRPASVVSAGATLRLDCSPDPRS